MHANTQIPKVIGYQRIAELAHDVQYHNASEYFWEIVTRQRSLALGGNSRREHFPTKETLHRLYQRHRWSGVLQYL